MSDETQEPNQPEPDGSGASGGGKVGSVRATLARRDARGRPIAVYGILGAGVFVLLVLMLVIYIWSSDRGKPEQPICTTITPDHASQDIRDGRVTRLILAYDEGVETPTDPSFGPVQAMLDYTDDSCAYLPQGISSQPDLLMVLGEIAFYNKVTDNAQVEIVYNALAGLDPALFTTPTLPPTETPVPTEGPPVTEAPATPASPTTEPTPSEPPSPPASTPAASPAATPQAATPDAIGTP